MKRNKLSVIFLAVGLLTFCSVSLLYSQGQEDNAKKGQPTVVQEGVMTDRQREHSRLYKGYGVGKKLRDLSAEVPTGVKVKKGPGMPVGEEGPSKSLDSFVEELTCNADAVIVGTVKDQSSQLTEDGDFIFTDYELTVEQVLKDNKFSHLEPNVHLIVTRPGGTIRLSGHIIEAEDASFKPLTIGQRYVLFLKYLPQTGAYTSLNSLSSYALGPNKIHIQTEEAVRSDLKNETPSAFKTKISAAVNECGDGSKRGHHE